MGISKTTMTQEFYVAARLFPNLTLWDSLVMIRNSISVSFAGEETKSRLMTMFEKEILEIIEKGVSFN
jgi:adenosine deaminase